MIVDLDVTFFSRISSQLIIFNFILKPKNEAKKRLVPVPNSIKEKANELNQVVLTGETPTDHYAAIIFHNHGFSTTNSIHKIREKGFFFFKFYSCSSMLPFYPVFLSEISDHI